MRICNVLAVVGCFLCIQSLAASQISKSASDQDGKLNRVESSVTSVNATIINKSNANLTLLTDCELNHGVFGMSPPNYLAPGDIGAFEAESDGIAWTEGSCTFMFNGDADQQLTLTWDNPPVGDNSYSTKVTPGAPYSAQYEGGKGYHSHVIFMVSS